MTIQTPHEHVARAFKLWRDERKVDYLHMTHAERDELWDDFREVYVTTDTETGHIIEMIYGDWSDDIDAEFDQNFSLIDDGKLVHCFCYDGRNDYNVSEINGLQNLIRL